ncbi:MAG TPA: DUF4390 domain-containing protein [Steroidobacteraceae bacterium]|nr:DUF4390 domain-containing protein [Steroidobacteraceae bacterium]
MLGALNASLKAPLRSLCAVLLLLTPCAVTADALDGVLQVRSAYVALEQSVFQLHARVDYPMTPAISAALADGVVVSFDVEVRIQRTRRLWFDATIADLTLHRELAYHTVSDRYVVHDPRSGDQQTFATLPAALMYLGTIDNWPVLVEPVLQPDDHYTIGVRAGIRRGHLPSSLRALLFWTNDWHRVSDWFTWSLTT